MGEAEARQDATPDGPGLEWQRTIADTLVARGVTVAAYVPDTRLQGILRALAGHNVLMRSLTREVPTGKVPTRASGRSQRAKLSRGRDRWPSM